MRLFSVLLLAMAAFSPACAAVDTKPTDLPDSRTLSMIKSIKQVGLKPPMALATDRDVYVIYLAGAACNQVTVLAKPTVEPLKLAQALSSACRGTELGKSDVEWGRDKDYSAARVSYSIAKFGQTSSTANAPVGEIMGGLRAAGLNAHGILRVGRYAQIKGLVFGQRGTTRYRWYDISAVPKYVLVSVSAKLPPYDIAGMGAFLLLIPAVGILSFVIAVAVARSGRIPIAKRRSLYPKIVNYPIFTAMFLQFPVGISFMRGPSMIAVGDLWSGVLRTPPFSRFVLLASLLIFAVIFPVSRAVEKKLFGSPNAPQRLEYSPDERRVLRSFQLSVFGIAVGLFVIAEALRYLVPSVNILLGSPILVGLLAGAFSPAIARRLMRKQVDAFQATREDPDLAARAAQLAQQMGARVKKLTIQGNTMSRNYARARVIPGGQIILSQKLVDEFTPGEVDFVLAHELAHLVRGDMRWKIATLITGALLFIVPLPLARLGVFGPSMIPLVAFMPLAGIFIVFVFSRWLSRSSEQATDKLALQTTRDLASAESALQKMAQFSPLPYANEIDTLNTHPKMSARIERLRKCAEELGILPGAVVTSVTE